jgi:hypothetical protein
MASLDQVASGAWAGFVGTVLGYPLDVVKSRMQTGKTGVVPPSATMAGVVPRAAQASFGEEGKRCSQKVSSILFSSQVVGVVDWIQRLRAWKQRNSPQPKLWSSILRHRHTVSPIYSLLQKTKQTM